MKSIPLTASAGCVSTSGQQCGRKIQPLGVQMGMMGCLLSSGEREHGIRKETGRESHSAQGSTRILLSLTHTQMFYFFLSSLLCLTHCGIPRILLSSFMRNNKLFLLAHMTNCLQTLLQTAATQPINIQTTCPLLNVFEPKK